MSTARIAATLVSAVAYALLFPPFGLDWLSWVALVPLLLAMRGLASWRAGLLVALWAWVGTVGIIAWLVPTLHQHFEQSLGFSVGFWLLFGVTALSPYYAVALGGWSHVAARLAAPGRALLFAACWVVAEYARVHLGFESPWTRLGDTHVDSPHLRQVADLGGVYAVSAVVALVNAAAAECVAAAWTARTRGEVAWRPAATGAATAIAVVGCVLLYGAFRLADEPTELHTLRVALVQGNVSPELRWRRTTASRVIHRYGGLTRELLVSEGPKPDLIVWPENAIQTPPDDPTYGGILMKMAGRGVPLLVGAPHSEETAGGRVHHNSAHLIHPDGRIDRYDKRRLLPFSETRPLRGLASFGSRGDLDANEYTPGRSPGVFEVGGMRIGVLICMEALYSALSAEAVELGADILVNLSNDGWYRGWGGAEQHLAQVVFRAIETRTPVVRVTTTGISAVIGPDGSMLARLGAGESGVLEVDVPVRGGPPTPYVRVGDALAVSCVLVLLLAVVRECWPRAQANSLGRTNSSRISA